MDRAAACDGPHPQSAAGGKCRDDRPRCRQQSNAREIRQEIIERTDGIPLFVEEMTKAVLEAERPKRRAKHTAAAIPSSALAVPATLHASLMARLDRLGGPAKELAQIGAAIGRELHMRC